MQSAVARSLTFVGGGLPGLNDWNGVTRVTSPGGTSVFSWWSDNEAFPGANDDLTITNNMAVTLTGSEYDPQDGANDLTDAGDSLTVTAGSSLDVGSTLVLGTGATNNGIGLANAGTVSDASLLTVAGSTMNDGTLSVADNAFLTVLGNIANSGMITLNAGSTSGSKLLIGAAVSLSESGKLLLTDAIFSRIEASVTGATLDNIDNTISGSGQIGFGTNDGPALTLSNQVHGTINANVNGGILTINTASLVNKGLIEAENNGTLAITSAIDNTGGVIQNLSGMVTVSGATIVGGTWESSDTNPIDVTGNSTFDGSDNAVIIADDPDFDGGGAVSVADNTFLTILGEVVNSGTITLQAGSTFGSKLLIGSAAVSLTGRGSLVLADATFSRIEASGVGATLDNVNNTISGSGQIGYGTSDGPALTLFNDETGTIDANVAGGVLTIDTSGIPLVNSGLIEATAGGTLSILTTIDNFSNVNGVIDALGGGITLATATIAGGTLESSGGNTIAVTGNSTFDGSGNVLSNSAAVSVADNIFLTVLGNIVNSGTITLQAGSTLGSKLLVDSVTVSLSGGGNLVLSDGDLSRIEAVAAGDVLDNVNNTTSGSGQIGFGTEDGPVLTLINEAGGKIDGNVSGGVLTINAPGATLINKGLIEASSGGTVAILSAVDNSNGTIAAVDGGTLAIQSAIDNTGNVINALGGGVSLFNATIAGGTLESGAVVNVTGDSTLDGSANAVTIAGDAVSVADNIFLTVLGNIVNSGEITLQAGSTLGSKLLVDSVTVSLSGSGNLVLSDTDLSRIEAVAAGDVLDNVNNTISGSGQIGFGTEDGPALTLINEVGGKIDGNVSGGVLTINTGNTVANDGILEANGGSLIVNDALTGSGSALITGGGTIVLNANFQQHLTFSGSGTLVLQEAPTPYTGTISGFASSDTIDLTALAYNPTHTATLVGHQLQISEDGYTYLLNVDPTQDYTGKFFHLTDDQSATHGTALTEDSTACYCRGTLILTPDGEVAIEELAIGDLLITLSGEAKPIRWIGRRGYNGRFIAGNADVLPIGVAPGALAYGIPARNLWVSPEHSLLIDDVLVQAKHLVNGGTVVQAESVEALEYFHIELASHDIIYADGAPAETFIDCDNRLMFANGADYARCYPEDDRPHWQFCAPRLEWGSPELMRVRSWMFERADKLGRVHDYDLDLHVLIDGVRQQSYSVSGNIYRFELPAGCGALRLRSRNMIPAEHDGASRDTRRLGVPLERVTLSTTDLSIEAWHGHPAFRDGFHADEPSHRWTDGNALIPEALLCAFHGPIVLEVCLATHRRSANMESRPAA